MTTRQTSFYKGSEFACTGITETNISSDNEWDRPADDIVTAAPEEGEKHWHSSRKTDRNQI